MQPGAGFPFGWVFADEGKKATSFSSLCKALGVQFDFSSSGKGLLSVCNTDARREELIQQILQALDRGWIEKQETLSLRGRLGLTPWKVSLETLG